MTKSKITHPLRSTDPNGIVSPEAGSIVVADLPLLLRIVFSKKITFVVCIVFSLAIAVAYSLLLPPIYKAEVILSQPPVSDYKELNRVTSGQIRIMPREVFFDLKKNLASRGNQYRFLKENSRKYFGGDFEFIFQSLDPNDVEERTGKFRSKNLTWLVNRNQTQKIHLLPSHHRLRIDTYSDVPDRFFFNLSVEWINAETAAYIANDYLLHIQSATIREWVDRVNYLIEERKTIVERLIRNKLDNAKVARENLILRLEESARTAEALGYVEPFLPTANRIELMPLHYRGSKSLRRQANILRERADDQPFVHDLHPLIQELDELQNIDAELFESLPANIDVAAYPPQRPVNKNWIFHLFLGLSFGVCLAAMVNIFRYYINVQRLN